jgi:hypothetical protein
MREVTKHNKLVPASCCIAYQVHVVESPILVRNRTNVGKAESWSLVLGSLRMLHGKVAIVGSIIVDVVASAECSVHPGATARGWESEEKLEKGAQCLGRICNGSRMRLVC